MAKLLLDTMCVLSTWEEMGGSAFSSDDLQLEDPADFTLDLRYWEARFTPLSALPVVASTFPPLFNPSEVSLSSLPSLYPTSSAGTAPSDSAQVVPMCPATSAVSFGDGMEADGFVDVFDVVECCNFDDLPLAFPGMEPLASSSPTSSDAGVVPDLNGGAQPLARHLRGSTATSGSDIQAAGSMTAAAVPTQSLPRPHRPASCLQHSSALFVPVNQTGIGGADVSNGLATIKPEPTTECGMGPYGDAALPSKTSAPTCLAYGPSLGPVSEQKARQSPTRLSAAGAAMAPQAQSAQQGGVHIRTRTECLERYREKKARRLYTKKIRYQLRKINADKRPRIKGRFVKKEELAEFMATQRVATVFAGGEGDAYGGAMDSEED